LAKLYVMSIRPGYARAVLEGRKRFELRRLTGLEPPEEGSTVIVYASGNTQSIVGEFKVGRLVIGSPEKVWELVGREQYGITLEARRYIEGARRAVAIEVREPRIYGSTVKLEKIRRIIPGWNPPHSYEELGEGDPFYELVAKHLIARTT
jgi:predicted transcriptional regulator